MSTAVKKSRAEAGEVTTAPNADAVQVTDPREDPPITFPYALDTFQQRSVDALEAGESVLVSAHTSAGKTTVALYAIAKALREKKRVIYTSPIKALSNQKFREFGEKFDSVGLMTGDTTIKPDSDCLVMTTEILRSMLYRGTEMLREVGCVVFDEVHYMRDKSRGVVWEETIVMLPEGCQYVFLSATIPNAREFADWVEHIHPGTKVNVIYTDFRPVPLQHFLYPQGAEGIFLVIDEASQFREDNFRKAVAVIGGGGGEDGKGGNGEDSGRGRKTGGRGGGAGKQTQPIMNIVKLAMDKGMYPVIVFSFAKKEVERNASALATLDFNSDEEAQLVEEVFTNAMESLKEEDRSLPAIEHLLPLLKRGVGVHHSGLLPILKEVVELLFQAGLVKCLFSTETFSMGLNMPARTVIFTAVTKWDGEGNRLLTGGEYIQMSGRAGRRGLDKFGIVIAMIDGETDPDPLRAMMVGGADTLNSSFHLTYNMVLNLLRVEDVDPEFMMSRSFFQFQRERGRPVLEAQVGELQQQIAQIRVEHEEVYEEYTTCTEQLAQLAAEDRKIRCTPKYMTPFLVRGRLVHIVRAADGVDFNFGICTSDAGLTAKGASPEDPTSWTVDIAVICMKPSGKTAATDLLHPCHVSKYNTEVAELMILPFSLADIDYATRFRIDLPRVLLSEESKATLVKALNSMYKKNGDNVPAIGASEMNIEGDGYTKLTKKIARLRAVLAENELSKSPSPDMLADYERYAQRVELQKQLEAKEEMLANLRRTVLKEELRAMMRVLRRLDYIDKEGMILRKGRVACEITTDDENELLLTELLFKGILNDMSTEMIVALMSCLVSVTRTPDNFTLPEEFQGPLNQLKEVVTRIASVSVESGLLKNSGEEGTGKGADMADRVMPALMEVTYRWAKGARFIDVIPLTSAYEGDIVRMMRRLEELLRQMAGAARSPAIGSIELHDRFLAGIQLIKRDIVFASSLYL